jgi:hypothetical protein
MTNEQLAYIQYEVIINLEMLCGLSQNEVTKLLQNTDILEFTDLSYELYHTQSIYYILEDLRLHLKDKYNIDIPLPKEPKEKKYK